GPAAGESGPRQGLGRRRGRELRSSRMSEPGAEEAYEAARLTFELGKRVREMREHLGWARAEQVVCTAPPRRPGGAVAVRRSCSGEAVGLHGRDERLPLGAVGGEVAGRAVLRV